MPQFLQQLLELADRAGGEVPKPECPDTASVDEIRLTAGNEQLLALYNRRDEFAKALKDWADLARRIEQRWPNWMTLKNLSRQAVGIQDSEVFEAQIETIEKQRMLLEDPDPVSPLIANLTQLLRDELNAIKTQWDIQWKAGESLLTADENWKQLEPEQRHELRVPHGLVEDALPHIDVADTDSILKTLNAISLPALKDRMAAMPGRYQQMLLEAAQLLEPMARRANLPSATLKSEIDVDVWLKDAEARLKEQLKQGPVII